uniref:Uncharacterized protein n=1 Tax=Nelumbo nucifera TaxID=4432 RepID=A0A822Y2Y0_NELNU|nr:TPA_asm: hypothetical protein HUJ06_029742 [Nelumbo nucifera]
MLTYGSIIMSYRGSEWRRDSVEKTKEQGLDLNQLFTILIVGSNTCLINRNSSQSMKLTYTLPLFPVEVEIQSCNR